MGPALLAAVGLSAAVDWTAVETDRRSVETVAKPLTLILLIAWVATLAAPAEGRGWVLAALAASLVGDVLLLPQVDRFIEGVGAFLLGHLLYVPALLPLTAARPTLAAAVVLGLMALVVGARIVRGAAATDRRLAAAVAVYVLAVGTTATLAVGTQIPAVAVGGVLFVISDALIGWTRFVDTIPHGRTVIHVTYHLAQLGLVRLLVP